MYSQQKNYFQYIYCLKLICSKLIFLTQEKRHVHYHSKYSYDVRLVEVRIVNLSTYKIAERFYTQFWKLAFDIFESLSMINLWLLSFISLVYIWYIDIITLLILYLYVSSTTAFLFSEFLPITSFPKQPHEQIMFFHRKLVTAWEKEMRRYFISAQTVKSQQANTKYQKPLQRSI